MKAHFGFLKNREWIGKEKAGSRKTIQDAVQERAGGGLGDSGGGGEWWL